MRMLPLKQNNFVEKYFVVKIIDGPSARLVLHDERIKQLYMLAKPNT